MTEKNHVLRSPGISFRRWLAAAALFFVSVGAWASFPATSSNTYNAQAFYSYSSLGSFTGYQATCNATKASAAANYAAGKAVVTGSSCAVTFYFDQAMTAQAASKTYTMNLVSSGYSCPANASASGATCTCNAGTVESNATCIVADGAYWANLLNTLDQTLAGEGGCGVSRCFQGFTITASGGTCWKDKTTGKTMYENYGPYSSSNVPCTATPAGGGASQVEPPATPGPADCNGYWGSVNGVDTCVPKGTSPGTGTATNDSKSTTTTDSSGTTTTTRDGVTVCQDGTCTTTRTTTTTTPGGTPTTVTSSSQQPQVSFCQENPSAKACQAADPCQENPDSLGCMKPGTPTEDQALPGFDSGFTSIGSVVFTSTAGCPADLPFTVLGKTYNFSYASACSTATTYGAPLVLVLGAALAAFVFVGGFKV
jgi:hypothetical protein